MFVSSVIKVNTIFPFVKQLQLQLERDPCKDNGGFKDEESKDFVGHTGCDKQGILLQTARAQVHPVEDTVFKVSTRILFDSGSQHSYISDMVRAKLQLKSIRSETIIIKTFGQDNDSEVKRLRCGPV